METTKSQEQTSISFKELVSIQLRKNSKKEIETMYSVKQNKDELKSISNWLFNTQEEANLAASMWLTIPKEKRDVNDFKHQFKHTLLILGVESVWTK